MQTSVADVAAVLVNFCPAGHSCVVQLVLTPVVINLPISQFVQSSKLENTAEIVEYWPAGHSWS